MARLDRIRQISHLLLCTDDAYRAYHEKVLKGQQDLEWARWYAEYLIGHGLDNVLEGEVPVEELEEYLRQTRQKADQEAPPDAWVATAAPVLLELISD